MITKQFQVVYQGLNHLSGGRLDIIKHAITTFSDTQALQAASGLAYYAIFSLFPLMLVLISAGSYFLDSEQVYQNVTNLVEETFPVSPTLIKDNLQEVLNARGTIGLIGLVTLLWSASGVFTNLAYNITLAWREASRRNFIHIRLVGLAMIGGLMLLIILSMIGGWITKLVPLFDVEAANSPLLNLWRSLSKLGSWLSIFLLYLALYYWVPPVRVDGTATFWAALTASLGWKIATAGFSLYLHSGLERYRLIYGSVGAILLLLFLIYIIAAITLFCAHLCASIDLWMKQRRRAG